MSQQLFSIFSRNLEANTNNGILREEGYKVVTKDTSNYFDQMRQMIIREGLTTQDHATLSLLQEMPNSHAFFIVRKSDDVVLGAVTIVDCDNFVYGNTYVMRKGFRATGLEVKLIKIFMYTLQNSLKTKPFIVRAVPEMWKPYVNSPFNVKFHYDMFSCKFADRSDLCYFFPRKGRHNYHVVSVKDIYNHKPVMFKDLVEYDRKVTGQDRGHFLAEFFSIDFVEGIALFDRNWRPKGFTAIVPTGNVDGLYKLNPIFAKNPEEAAILIHSVADLARHPAPSFVTHIRTKSAGDWILNKCRSTKRDLHYIGATISATNMASVYRDRSKAELIFAPTSSAAHFDG